MLLVQAGGLLLIGGGGVVVDLGVVLNWGGGCIWGCC